MRKKWLLLGVCLPLSLLCGRELFVSPSGSNKNPGTAKAPFKTIAFAASKAMPGDTVKIGPGIYREEITVKNSGKKNAPITFAGTRGKDGKWLSIIESPGITLSKWVKAPEIGPDVWKTKVAKNPLLVMMDGKMIAKVNNNTMNLPRWKNIPTDLIQTHFMSKFGPGCKRLPGMDFFILSKDATFKHVYFHNVKSPFWQLVNYVLCGWKDGYLYLRFVNGDSPEKHTFTASYGNGVSMRNVSYLNFRDLFLRGSRTQFLVSGKTSHITIENCLMMHGGYRVRIESGASFVTVRNNTMTCGFTIGDYFKHRDASDPRGGLIYTIFKYLIGNNRSDDVGIYCKGRDVLIEDNVIFQGLIGIDAIGPRVIVRNNALYGLSSVGICTGATTIGRFYENLVMECGIPLRIHNLRHERAKREEYHYRNIFMQGLNGGGFIFVHCESFKTPADRMNFEGRVYKKNPPDPVDPGKFFIYHNTFWGGGNLNATFDVRGLSRRFRGPLPFHFINNVAKDSPRYYGKAHDVLTGNLLYKTMELVKKEKRLDPTVPQKNRVLSLKESGKLWRSGKKSSGMAAVALASDPRFECAVDISKPYTFNGKKYDALPGFEKGYFKGKAPFPGALQKNESDELFRKLYDKCHKAMTMIKNLK